MEKLCFSVFAVRKILGRIPNVSLFLLENWGKFQKVICEREGRKECLVYDTQMYV